jgi:uncharacterized membrane protein YdjX (TVP38/TMEM64 family)
MSFLVRRNIDFFQRIINQNYYEGIIIFILIDILSIVVAPVTSIPLVPVASNTYGIFLTFIFYMVGGFIGSLIAFWIGRNYGKNFAAKFISVKRAEEVAKKLPEKNLILTIVLLRIATPADLLSYALGIFTKISYKIFIITLILGTIPAAIFFPVLGSLSLKYEIIGWIAGITITIIILYFLFRRKKSVKS